MQRQCFSGIFAPLIGKVKFIYILHMTVLDYWRMRTIPATQAEAIFSC